MRCFVRVVTVEYAGRPGYHFMGLSVLAQVPPLLKMSHPIGFPPLNDLIYPTTNMKFQHKLGWEHSNHNRKDGGKAEFHLLLTFPGDCPNSTSNVVRTCLLPVGSQVEPVNVFHVKLTLLIEELISIGRLSHTGIICLVSCPQLKL